MPNLTRMPLGHVSMFTCSYPAWFEKDSMTWMSKWALRVPRMLAREPPRTSVRKESLLAGWVSWKHFVSQLVLCRLKALLARPANGNVRLTQKWTVH